MIKELDKSLEEFIKVMESVSDYDLRVNNVARILKCSSRTVYRLIEEEKLDAIRTTPRNTRVSRKSVVHFLKTRNCID